MTIAQTRWSDEAFAEKVSYGGVRQGSRLVDTRSAAVPLPARKPSRRSSRLVARRGGTRALHCGGYVACSTFSSGARAFAAGGAIQPA